MNKIPQTETFILANLHKSVLQQHNDAVTQSLVVVWHVARFVQTVLSPLLYIAFGAHVGGNMVKINVNSIYLSQIFIHRQSQFASILMHMTRLLGKTVA
jgi:hypothetical protein